MSDWISMDSAPKTGESIIGKYGDESRGIMWSDRPICMLGSRNGGFPEG